MSVRVKGFGFVVAGAVLAALAGLVVGSRLLGQPDAAAAAVPDLAAGLRAQHGLAELLMRGGGVSSRADPIEITAGELNALLSRHVRARRLPLRPLVVRAEEGKLEIAGRTSLRQLGPGSVLGWLLPVLPDGLVDIDLWVAVDGRLEVRPGEGEFVVERAAVGRQRVPPGWLWRFLDVDPRENLTWRMPRIVERVEVRRDRLLIYTRRGGA